MPEVTSEITLVVGEAIRVDLSVKDLETQLTFVRFPRR